MTQENLWILEAFTSVIDSLVSLGKAVNVVILLHSIIMLLVNNNHCYQLVV